MSRSTPDEIVPPLMATTVGPRPRDTKQYHVFVASPGDVNDERQAVRDFLKTYNLNYAEPRGLHFEIIGWENYSGAGVGRPQELITEQTLERYRNSLALVVGIMAQRFGSKSGTHESGTEEEFEWAVSSYAKHGFPEVKWFFRDVKQFTSGPKNWKAAGAQWEKVQAFRERIDADKKVYFRSYEDLSGFRRLLENDIGRWLNSPDRPWFRPGPSLAEISLQWPQQVLESLATRLGAEFVFHMRVGENLSPDQARSRYVQGVLKLRRRPDDGSAATKTQVSPNEGEGPLEDFLATEGLQLLVVGAGGSGKSTMLKRLAANGARRAVQDLRAPVFVYLRLASFDRKGGFDLLLDLLRIAALLDRKEFEVRWREGPRPIVFLLDGFNEVAQSCQESCARALSTFLQNSPLLHRSIITSRPGSEFEAMSSHSSEHQRLGVADVLEFKPLQIQEYLRAQGRIELQSRISGSLEGLASNPFLLWAITRALASTEATGLRARQEINAQFSG